MLPHPWFFDRFKTMQGIWSRPCSYFMVIRLFSNSDTTLFCFMLTSAAIVICDQIQIEIPQTKLYIYFPCKIFIIHFIICHHLLLTAENASIFDPVPVEAPQSKLIATVSLLFMSLVIGFIIALDIVSFSVKLSNHIQASKKPPPDKS